MTVTLQALWLLGDILKTSQDFEGGCVQCCNCTQAHKGLRSLGAIQQLQTLVRTALTRLMSYMQWWSVARGLSQTALTGTYLWPSAMRQPSSEPWRQVLEL